MNAWKQLPARLMQRSAKPKLPIKHSFFKRAMFILLALLMISVCFNSIACSNEPPYSWINDTEFNGLSKREQLDMITVAAWDDGYTWEDNRTAGFSAVAVASDGSVYVAGGSNADSFVLKYSKDLVLEREAVHLGKRNLRSIAIAADGAVYVSGGAYGYGVILKFDNNLEGILASVTQEDVMYTAIAVDKDGYLYATASVFSGLQKNAPAIIIKYDKNLVEQGQGYAEWNKEIEDYYFTSISIAPDGSVFAAGYTNDYRYLISKYSSGLLLQHTESQAGSSGYQDSNNAAAAPNIAISIDPKGNIYIVYTIDDGNSNICKYDNSFIRSSHYVGVEGSIRSLAIAADSTVYAAGCIYTSDYTACEAIAVRFNSSLSELNHVNWGGNGNDSFAAIAISPGGDIYVAGSSSSTDTENTGFFLDKGSVGVVIK